MEWRDHIKLTVRTLKNIWSMRIGRAIHTASIQHITNEKKIFTRLQIVMLNIAKG